MKAKSKAIKKYAHKIKNLDCCPTCKKKFACLGPKIVFKDVLECKNCGAIWVTMDDSIITRWARC